MRLYAKFVLFGLLIFFIAGCALSLNNIKQPQIFTVRGNSLEPMIKEGSKMKLIKANEYKRGDIIMYKVAGHNTPVAKIIKGVPGDVWSLDEGKIIVNDEVLKNSAGETYNIETEMLKLFTRKYPTIPDKQYLIFGDQPASTLDSSKFGFARIDRMLGKLVKIN